MVRCMHQNCFCCFAINYLFCFILSKNKTKKSSLCVKPLCNLHDFSETPFIWFKYKESNNFRSTTWNAKYHFLWERNTTNQNNFFSDEIMFDMHEKWKKYLEKFLENVWDFIFPCHEKALFPLIYKEHLSPSNI